VVHGRGALACSLLRRKQRIGFAAERVEFAPAGSSCERGPWTASGLSGRQQRTGATTMRFMILVKATRDTEQGVMPSEALIASIAECHAQLAEAGVLLDASGLQPSGKGWRVHYDGAKRRVVDGPFAEAKELVAGYTLIQTRTRDEALEWTRR